MAGTKLRAVVREGLGNIWREIKIAATPVPKPEKWLFLVGCYNSGTTLLAELLSRHAEISSLPVEGHFITDQFVKDYEIGVPRMWVDREPVFRLTEDDTGPDPLRIKKEWGMRAKGRRAVFMEKSPPNTARTRWLQKHFREAYFVAIVRNGYAVSEGISRKGDPKHFDNGWPIEKSAWQWHRSNQVLIDDAEYLERIIWVSYEELCNDPQLTLEKIFKFVGLNYRADLYSHENLKIHERNEPIRDMNEMSIANLTRADLDMINGVAGDSLRRFGYRIL